jgi:hypothetical protein
MSSRKLIREFLDAVSVCPACGHNPCKCVELCGECHCDPCECPGHAHEDLDCSQPQEDYSLDSLEHGEAHHEIEFNDDGSISPHELFHHFDLNDDGVVTPQEYVDHIEYHAAHPETLDHYKQLRDASVQSVPCKDSYHFCSQHLMSNPSDIELYLKPLMDATGSTCKASTVASMSDVIKALMSCGLI